MSKDGFNITGSNITGGIAIGTGAQATGGGAITNGNAVDLPKLLALIHARTDALAEPQRAQVQERLRALDLEAISTNPDKGKIRALLQSVKSIAEGTIGSLIASAIDSL
jgi:hypothetical protein